MKHILVLLLFSGTSLHGLGNEKELFLARNPEIVVKVFALTSPEREIEAEKTYQKFRREKGIKGKGMFEDMIDFWSEFRKEMPEGSNLYQVAFENKNGETVSEGFVVLKGDQTIKTELLNHLELQLN